MGTAAYRRREFLYLLLIGTQKRMLSICIGRSGDYRIVVRRKYELKNENEKSPDLP